MPDRTLLTVIALALELHRPGRAEEAAAELVATAPDAARAAFLIGRSLIAPEPAR
jgi:hypothetical protein